MFYWHYSYAFIKLNQNEATITIIITHDPNIAAQCKRQMVMKNGKFVN